MAKAKTPAEAQAAPAPAPEAPKISVPRYIEYTGEQRGSLMGRDGEPIGRVERGAILRLDTPEQVQRVQDLAGNYLPDWKGTTAARFNEQEAAAGRLMTEEVEAPATGEPMTPGTTGEVSGTEPASEGVDA